MTPISDLKREKYASDSVALKADGVNVEATAGQGIPPLSESLTPVEVPPDVYSMVKIPAAARALRLPARQLRAEVDAGRVPCRQPGGRYGDRYILTADIARLALAYGIPVDWDELAAVD